MINNTDIFTRLDWLTNKVNRILGALQNGGGGGAQNINQVLATGATATNKTLLFNNTIGNNRTLQISETSLLFLDPDDSYSSQLSASAFQLKGAYTLLFNADQGSITTSGTAGSVTLKIYPDLFEVSHTIGGSTETGLSLNFDTNVFGFGDTNSLAGLFINAASNYYQLGNFDTSIKGLDMNIGPTIGDYFLGNQDGAFFRVHDADTGSYIVTSFPGGGESGLGLFNNTGHYKLGDFAGTAQPDTYNVYLDVSSSKADSSIKTYINNLNSGLLLDFNAGRYIFNMPNLASSGDAWFGVKAVVGTGGVEVPCLDMTYSILGSPATAIPSQFSWIRVDVQGIRFWIPLYSDNT